MATSGHPSLPFLSKPHRRACLPKIFILPAGFAPLCHRTMTPMSREVQNMGPHAFPLLPSDTIVRSSKRSLPMEVVISFESLVTRLRLPGIFNQRTSCTTVGHHCEQLRESAFGFAVTRSISFGCRAQRWSSNPTFGPVIGSGILNTQ